MLKMPNKTELDNNYKGINLETLREQEAAIKNTFEWWNSRISKAAGELEKESKKLTPNYGRVEQLEKEIELLQCKGAAEQRILDNFSAMKEKYLISCLLSGIASTKISC